MEGAVRILRRFVVGTILISFFLLILNFIILAVWFFRDTYEGESPQAVVEKVSKSLKTVDGQASYTLDARTAQQLSQLHVWAMLVAPDGQVVWSYQLPTEIPRTYSLVQVAQFSRNFLNSYPTFVWEHGQGLVVIGYPKDSIAKYESLFPTDWVREIPLRFLVLLSGNLLLALLLAILIGSRQIKSLKPLIAGIHALGKEQPVHLEPNGVLSDLARSINHTSTLLQEKNAALKARDEARANWIAGISHDIRTPLSMILGYASELEEDGSVPEDQRKKAGIIRRHSEKLRSLISDLNLVTILEYEMQPLQMKPVRLSALARQVATEFLNNGLGDEYTLELDVPDEGLKVSGDEKLLLRAVTNLVQNSITHNPEGCQIWLRTSLNEDGKNCRFIVSDDGKGLPERELPYLLELPSSFKRKAHVPDGHGLGLPMIARIAKAHQGKLVLTSEPGQGLLAEIVLPLLTENR